MRISTHPRCLAQVIEPGRNSFGLIRLLAAALVAVSHNMAITTGALSADPVYGLTGFSMGQHAVHVFFVLSGVLVSASLCRSRSFSDFITARLLRIYPGFAVCVVVVALVVAPVISSRELKTYFSDPALASHIAQTLTMITAKAPLPGVFESNPVPGEVNLSVWTLKYEILCYAMLALLGAIGLAQPRLAVWVLVLGCAALACSYLKPDLVTDDSVLDNTRRFTLCFFLGVIAFAHRHRFRLSGAAAFALALGAFLASETRAATPVLIVATAYLTLFIASFRIIPLLSDWTDRHDLSYGLYLYGWPVAQTVILLFPAMTLSGLQALTFLIALPVAWASWHWIEAPSLRLRKQLVSFLGSFPATASPEASRR